MDDVIYEEFKGTGNLELHLNRKMAERRVFPAFEVERSGTRREELMLDDKVLGRIWTLRRMIQALGGGNEALEVILERLPKSATNEDFLNTLHQH
jgi:transcription termination factor Rho